MGINGPSISSINEVLWHYTVTFTNRTTDVFDEVVIFYSTPGGAISMVKETNLQPGNRRVLDLGVCSQMVSYNLGVFIGTTMVAKFPETGSMTRELASQLNPTDRFLCEDSWFIEAG
jgi:hypothetical protein